MPSIQVHHSPAVRPHPFPGQDQRTQFVRNQVDFWCAGASRAERMDLNEAWSKLHFTEAAGLRTGQRTPTETLFRLLEKVSSIGEGGRSHRVTDTQVATAMALLRTLPGDDALRAECCAQALAGMEDCEDNVLAQFEKIGMQVQFRNARTPEEFVQAARAVAVDKLLRDHVAKAFPGASDPLEVQRYLGARLASRLRVPEPNMTHHRFAKGLLGSGAGRCLREAYRDVREHLHEQTTQTLLAVPRWESALKTEYHDALQACMAPLQDAMYAALYGGEQLEGSMLAQANALSTSYQSVESRALRDLTSAWVLASRPKSVLTRIRELLSCHAPEKAQAQREAELLRSIHAESVARAKRGVEPASNEPVAVDDIARQRALSVSQRIATETTHL